MPSPEMKRRCQRPGTSSPSQSTSIEVGIYYCQNLFTYLCFVFHLDCIIALRLAGALLRLHGFQPPKAAPRHLRSYPIPRWKRSPVFLLLCHARTQRHQLSLPHILHRKPYPSHRDGGEKLRCDHTHSTFSRRPMAVS